MLLACNIENAVITMGVFDGDTLLFKAEFATLRERTADEHAILLNGAFALNQATLRQIDAAIIASVVRPLNAPLVSAIERLMHIRPLVVGPGLKSGLNIKTDIPSQLGADIVANAVAALTLAPGPLVFVDFGSATTLTAINARGELCGVLICPGLRTSLDALSAGAAELPAIALERPRNLIGRNTNDAMSSGVIHGHAAMVDGLVERIADDWGESGPEATALSVIATGSHADAVVPYCRGTHRIQVEPNLTLIGLKRIHQLNQRLRAKGTDEAPAGR